MIRLATQHYKPNISVVVERYKFNSENQEETQTISSYVAELKRRASNCNFGANLTQQLRDRLVGGMSSERIRRRLLQEGDDLTWDKACKLALAMEASTTEAKLLAGEHKEALVNKVEPPRTKPGERTNEPTSRWGKAKFQNRYLPREAARSATCSRWGSSYHKATECPCVSCAGV